MASYLLRRLMLMGLTLFGMSVLIFIALRLVPGNIADILVDSAGIVDNAQKLKIEHDSGGTCWQPYVKGFTMHENSIYNNTRFEDVWLDK